MSKVTKGSVPPSFTLKNQDGKNVSLSQFKGKPVVVYFYPADDTPGCTKQVTNLQMRNNLKFMRSQGHGSAAVMLCSVLHFWSF